MRKVFMILVAVMMTVSAMAEVMLEPETAEATMETQAAAQPSDAPMIIMIILIFVVGMALLCGCIYLTYKMAKNRYRDPALWILLAFVTSPIIAWIALLIVGEDELRKKQLEEMEER